MQHTPWDHALKVTGDGAGLVGHAGAILLRKAADQAGLTAWLGAALPLKRQKKAVIADRLPDLPTRRKELTIRLRARRCEWCDTLTDVEIHQVRKLADLARAGRPQPGWAQLMTRMRRKTLVVCTPCHQAIHHGHPIAITA
jgi:hypothetical protein